MRFLSSPPREDEVQRCLAFLPRSHIILRSFKEGIHYHVCFHEIKATIHRNSKLGKARIFLMTPFYEVLTLSKPNSFDICDVLLLWPMDFVYRFTVLL